MDLLLPSKVRSISHERDDVAHKLIASGVRFETDQARPVVPFAPCWRAIAIQPDFRKIEDEESPGTQAGVDLPEERLQTTGAGGRVELVGKDFAECGYRGTVGQWEPAERIDMKRRFGNAAACEFDHCRRDVDPDHLATTVHKMPGDNSTATSEIDHRFATESVAIQQHDEFGCDSVCESTKSDVMDHRQIGSIRG